KSLRDVCRDGFQQLQNVVCNQQLLAEGVKLFQLQATCRRRARFPPRPLGELAGNNRGKEKSNQRYPVLCVGNSESPDGRQKEKIEAKCGQNGHGYGISKSPGCGNNQNGQQECQRDSCWVDMDVLEIDKDDQRD